MVNFCVILTEAVCECKYGIWSWPCFLLACGESKLEKEETNFAIPWVSDENLMPTPIYATYIMLLQKVVLIFVAVEFTLELHLQCPHCFFHFMLRIIWFLCFLLLIQVLDRCLLSSLCNKFESVLFVVIGCTKEPLYSVKFVKSFMCSLSCCYAIWLARLWNEEKQCNSSNLCVKSNVIFPFLFVEEAHNQMHWCACAEWE
jgi:hypothetical protein